MRQQQRNELFHFLHKEHQVLLTQNEIDDIISIVDKSDRYYAEFVKKKVVAYRIIASILLGLLTLVFVLFSWPMIYVILIFIAYNIIQALLTEYFQIIKVNGNRRLVLKR